MNELNLQKMGLEFIMQSVFLNNTRFEAQLEATGKGRGKVISINDTESAKRYTLTVSVRDLISKIDNDSIVIQEKKIKTAVEHGGETLAGIIVITAEDVHLKIEPIVYDGKPAYYKFPKDEPSAWVPNGTNTFKDEKFLEKYPIFDTSFEIICK